MKSTFTRTGRLHAALRYSRGVLAKQPAASGRTKLLAALDQLDQVLSEAKSAAVAAGASRMPEGEPRSTCE